MKGEVIFGLIDKTNENLSKLAELQELTEEILGLAEIKSKCVEKSVEKEIPLIDEEDPELIE